MSYEHDKRFRLMHKLSYLDEKKFSTFFENGPPNWLKMGQNFFSSSKYDLQDLARSF